MSTTRETRHGYKIGDSYAGLLEQFPLWKISSEREYDRATAVLQELFGRDDLDADEAAYLDSLTVLVKEYETRTYSLDTLANRRTPLDMLRHLMDANEVNQVQLAKVLGVGESSASMLLSGARGITARHARILGKHFHVDAGLFV